MIVSLMTLEVQQTIVYGDAGVRQLSSPIGDVVYPLHGRPRVD
jgi:hypothetical protein